MTHEAIHSFVEGGSILFTYALETGSRRIQKLVTKELRFEPFYNAVYYTINEEVDGIHVLDDGFPNGNSKGSVINYRFFNAVG